MVPAVRDFHPLPEAAPLLAETQFAWVPFDGRSYMLRRRTSLNGDLGPLRRELNTTISGKVPLGRSSHPEQAWKRSRVGSEAPSDFSDSGTGTAEWSRSGAGREMLSKATYSSGVNRDPSGWVGKESPARPPPAEKAGAHKLLMGAFGNVMVIPSTPLEAE